MPLFPGERPMTPEEGEMGAGFFDVENAFAHEGEFFSAVTGLQRTSNSFRTGDMLATLAALPPDTAHFSVVEVENGDFDGYIIARPFRQIAPGHFEPDPHHWWVFDSDLDESDAAWVSQAEFTPDGFINHGDPPDFDVLGGLGFNPNGPSPNVESPEDADDDGSGFYDDDDVSPPQATTAPTPSVRGPVKSIDDVLDDVDDKSVPQWRKVGANFEVLESELGTAFLCNSPGHTYGLIRYTDGVCVEITGKTCDEVRHSIPKALRNRPVVMQTLDLDEDKPSPPVPVEKEAADPYADTEPPRPPPPPRKWNTIPINSGDDD